MTAGTTAALGWTLIHFVWQGGLVALLLGVANAILRRGLATTRYAVSCGALLLMLAAPIATFSLLTGKHSRPMASSLVEARSIAQLPSPKFVAATPRGHVEESASLPTYFPWLVRLWFAGVILLSLRSAGAWLVAQRLKHSRVKPAATEFDRIIRRLRSRLAISRTVRLYESAIAEVPSVIGWIRPVILLPVSALTALSPEQIEYLLAHELAHIRRHDYLINLLQTAVETVLFYHPAVWWVSAQIRLERENCCDDLAVQSCGDALDYARTLAQLEELRVDPGLALAANGGSLLARIQRLAGRDAQRPHAAPAWLALPVLAGVLMLPGTVLSGKPQAAPAPASTPSAPPSSSQRKLAKVNASRPAPEPAPVPQPRGEGYLAGLADAQYTNISIDEIISLKQNGIDPRYIKELKNAGLGTPKVEQVINLHRHGVGTDFAAAVVKSGLVRDLNFDALVHLKDWGVNADDMARIRSLGFGPYSAEDVGNLHRRGVHAETFEALKEGGFTSATVNDAMEAQRNGLNTDSMRSLRNQGFTHLTLEQIFKLHRAGII
jgi:beta-lactamase regulating signal transducer with metallopeptidase domain